MFPDERGRRGLAKKKNRIGETDSYNLTVQSWVLQKMTGNWMLKIE